MPSPFWRRPVEAPSYFDKMRAWTIYGLVYQSVLTPEQGKEFLRNFSAERGLDPELRSEESLSEYKQHLKNAKNDSPRR